MDESTGGSDVVAHLRVAALLIAAVALLGFAGCGGGDDDGNGGAPTATEETTTEEDQGEAGGEGEAGGDGAAANLPAGNASAGSEAFAQNCSTCHGSTGAGAATGPSLQNSDVAEDFDAVAQQVIEGGGGMPPFGDTLSDQEIADVSAYVTEDIAGR